MQMLKASFLENQVPSPEEKQELSEQLKVPLEQVIVWPHGTLDFWCCTSCASQCRKTCKLQPLRCYSAENQGCDSIHPVVRELRFASAEKNSCLSWDLPPKSLMSRFANLEASTTVNIVECLELS